MPSLQYHGIQKKYVIRFFLVLSIALPFFLLSTKLLPWRNHLFIQNLVYPFEYSWFWLSKNSKVLVEDYIALQNAAADNRKLKLEIEDLKVKMMDYQEVREELSRLRELLDFRNKKQQELVVAEVLASANPLSFSTIRTNRGKTHGVLPGMPAISSLGVVGKIIRVGSRYSDVQLITDANFNLDVLLQRTRVRGILRGISQNKCMLQMEQEADVRIGDVLVTSGITGAFPKGIPVGRVVKISYATDDVAQNIFVDPWVDSRRIEELSILLREDPELKKISSTVGEEWLDQSLEKAYGNG